MMQIEKLLGEVLTKVESSYNNITFYCESGKIFDMYHDQDCCEDVYVEDVCGSFENLYNSPIEMAEESSNSGDNEWGTETWTFYRLATVNGYVTIRWYGSSNGYYSESVEFRER